MLLPLLCACPVQHLMLASSTMQLTLCRPACMPLECDMLPPCFAMPCSTPDRPSRIVNVSSAAHYFGHIDFDDLQVETFCCWLLNYFGGLMFISIMVFVRVCVVATPYYHALLFHSLTSPLRPHWPLPARPHCFSPGGNTTSGRATARASWPTCCSRMSWSGGYRWPPTARVRRRWLPCLLLGTHATSAGGPAVPAAGDPCHISTC